MKHTMLKYTYTFLVGASIVLALLLATSAFAEDTAPETPNQDPASIQNSDNDSTVTRIERRVERKAMLAQGIQDRIVNLTSNVTDRLQAGIDRLDHIITRIDSRIVKLKAEGYDTTGAEQRVGDAKTTLEVAKKTLAEARSAKKAVGSDTPREAYKEIRVQLSGVQDLLKQTRALLKETVVLLKETMQKKGSETAETEAISANEQAVEITQ